MTNNNSSPSSSTTSPKPRSSMLGRALSSLSTPVEDWGLSDVPLLSSQVTPRRARVLPGKTPDKRGDGSGKFDGDGIRDGSPTTSRLRSGMAAKRSRVLSMRPLSIASVSTFGLWMFEQHTKHDAGGNDDEEGILFGSPATEELSRTDEARLSTREGGARFSPSLSSSSSELEVRARGGFPDGMHPLRMHPPSPTLSAPASETAREDQDTASLPPLSLFDALRSPSISTFTSHSTKASQTTINTRRSRPSLAELDVHTANTNSTPHDEALDLVSLTASAPASPSPSPASSQSPPPTPSPSSGVASGEQAEQLQAPFPREKGYVEALRAWYEEMEKENEGLALTEKKKGSVRERRFAKRLGGRKGEGVLACVSANQRL